MFDEQGATVAFFLWSRCKSARCHRVSGPKASPPFLSHSKNSRIRWWQKHINTHNTPDRMQWDLFMLAIVWVVLWSLFTHYGLFTPIVYGGWTCYLAFFTAKITTNQQIQEHGLTQKHHVLCQDFAKRNGSKVSVGFGISIFYQMNVSICIYII